jgi:hypothetical protein
MLINDNFVDHIFDSFTHISPRATVLEKHTTKTLLLWKATGLAGKLKKFVTLWLNYIYPQLQFEVKMANPAFYVLGIATGSGEPGCVSVGKLPSMVMNIRMTYSEVCSHKEYAEHLDPDGEPVEPKEYTVNFRGIYLDEWINEIFRIKAAHPESTNVVRSNIYADIVHFIHHRVLFDKESDLYLRWKWEQPTCSAYEAMHRRVWIKNDCLINFKGQESSVTTELSELPPYDKGLENIFCGVFCRKYQADLNDIVDAVNYIYHIVHV